MAPRSGPASTRRLHRRRSPDGPSPLMRTPSSSWKMRISAVLARLFRGSKLASAREAKGTATSSRKWRASTLLVRLLSIRTVSSVASPYPIYLFIYFFLVGHSSPLTFYLPVFRLFFLHFNLDF